jgi:arylsulfatase A-like enzyme
MGPACERSGAIEERPNILWIVTTQWRAQACGYAGDPNARTPCLDALAAESVNFAQAVTPHPFGPFARAALLTGVLSPANGVAGYFDPLPPGARTLAHEMAELGFATAFFGKWHLGRRDPAEPLVGEAHARALVPPEGRGGFAFWEGFESGFQLNGPWLHGTRLPEPRRFDGYQSDVVCDRAAGWLESQTEECFCVVSLEPPHPPYDAPASGMEPPEPAGIELVPNVPRGGAAEQRARGELSGYYAHIEATDWALGRLISRVDDLRRPTAIFFTSVHGDMHGAHGLFRKGWPHEESVRVPLLVREPSRGRGRESAAAASLIDLPRMTRELIAAPRASTLDLDYPAAARISMPSVVARPPQCDRAWKGARSPTRKLVLGADGSPWLYFDLEIDPLETRNMAGDPGRADEIAEISAFI